MSSTDVDETSTDETDASRSPKAPVKNAPPDKVGERKLVPPPPIIGPDGKELPRPRDAQGRPMPIYVGSDKKPILDENGMPIALRFTEDGKPIPLNEWQNQGGGVGRKDDRVRVVEKNKETKVPEYLIWVGIVDFAALLAVAIYYAYTSYKAFESNSKDKIHFTVTAATFCVGAMIGCLPILAVKRNKNSFLWIWVVLTVLLLGVQVGVSSLASNFILPAVIIHSIHLLGILLMICIYSMDDSQSRTTVRQNIYTTSSRGGVGGQQTVIVQQQPHVAVVPSYGYGYGYPYGYGYGYDATDAALLGFAAGSMLGGGYGGWGWGGYGGYSDFGFGGYSDFGYGGFGGYSDFGYDSMW